MQTARRTRSSVGQAFDHHVATFNDGFDDRLRCRFGVGGLAETLHGDALTGKSGGNGVEKLVAALFGNAEQTYRFARKTCGRRDSFAHDRRLFGRRIAHDVWLISHG